MHRVMFSRLRLLHIEDDVELRESIAGILGVYNAVESAETLAEGERKLRAGTFDILLLDKSLPDGNAQDLIPKARHWSPELPILLITGDTDFLSVTECLLLGATDYIFKSPRLVQDLLLRIPVIITNHRRREPWRSDGLEMPRLPGATSDVSPENYECFLRDSERLYLTRCLSLCGYDVERTAGALGMGRSTLFKRIADLKIPRHRPAEVLEVTQ